MPGKIVKVESSNIEHLQYDRKIKVLTIKFLSGSSYNYAPVEPSLYKDFLNAPSKGTFFHQNLQINPLITVTKS